MTNLTENAIRATTQDWYFRTPDHTPFTLEELLRYTTAVGDAIARKVTEIEPLLTPRCTECGRHVRSMTEYEKDDHIIICGYVIVACEWYWVVDPNLVGIADTWCSWREDLDTEQDMEDAQVKAWIETGRWYFEEDK